MNRYIAYGVVFSLAFGTHGSPLMAQKGKSTTATEVPAPFGVPNVVAPSLPVRPAQPGQPRMDGSTTAVLLGHMLAGRNLGLNGQVQRLPRASRWAGASSSAAVVFPLESDPTKMADFQTWMQAEPQYSGTPSAYKSLINDAADLIVVARVPSDDELKMAKEKGVEFDLTPIALDAFIFLVNTENKLQGLTLEQIRDIYTGKAKNWKDVGGIDQSILAFTRDRNSGSQELMEKLVMQDRKMIEGRDRMMSSMMGPIEGVSRQPNSIAYSVYYYEHVMSPQQKNKLLAINGVAPTAQTIGSRQYPLTAEVYVVTRRGIAAISPAAKLRDWLLSDDGQKLLKASGYVPIKNPVTIDW